MKLGFHYHIPAVSRDGHIYTQGNLGCFLDSLATNIEFLTCFLHSPYGTDIDLLDYRLQNENISFENLGPHVSVPERMLRVSSIKKIIAENRKILDLMLIRGPSPLLSAIANSCKNTPIALLIVGDYLAGIDDPPQPWWRKELIRLWSWRNYKEQIKIAKKSLTLVNSHLLYKQFQPKVKNLIETKTSTLNLSDFFEREDTCQQQPIRLLFTGRITRAKGLSDIVEALNILLKDGYDIIFDIVGMMEIGDPILAEINNTASNYHLSDRVIYHGYKPLGQELFQFYKQADIYVIASQASEGFPRTIWEAMAHSLPVVATRVGSTPDYIEGASSLISPRSPQEIAKAISQLITDQEYRRENIKKGYLLAKENTLEVRSKEMISYMENYLKKVKHD